MFEIILYALAAIGFLSIVASAVLSLFADKL